MIDTPAARVSQLELCPSINVSFPLRGTQPPAHHGHLPDSAISKRAEARLLDSGQGGRAGGARSGLAQVDARMIAAQMPRN